MIIIELNKINNLLYQICVDMKKLLFAILTTFLCKFSAAQPWKPAGEKIKTQWADKVDVNNPLPEYPRPQMVRTDWINLNGLWDYAILPKGNNIPSAHQG